MRIGIAGLNGLYWPMSIGNGLSGKPGVEFLAAATLGESGTAIKESLGLSPAEYVAKYNLRLYDQAEDMVKSEKLDTVAIVTRHTAHADWVERLAKLGVNIYLPKTFATTLADAGRIVEAEKQNRIRIAVGPSARYLPAMVSVKQALEMGLIGQPFALRICHHHGTIDGFHANDWYRDPQEGGPELSLAWYGIDLVQHLMGDKVKTVFAKYGNYTTPDSPFMDCGRIVMEMVGGGVASFDMYFCNRVAYPSWQLEVVGPKGVISLHRTEGESARTVVSLDGVDGYQLLPVPQETPHWEMFWVDELLQGKNLSVTAEYAQQVTLISLAARDSARRGEVVALPVKEN
jgi:predicted dehydrogenase